MSLNELLKNEQITIMRHASAAASIDGSVRRRKLNMFKMLLEAHPYPHRPYSPPNRSESLSSVRPASKPAAGPSLAGWENEGGAY